MLRRRARSKTRTRPLRTIVVVREQLSTVVQSVPSAAPVENFPRTCQLPRPRLERRRTRRALLPAALAARPAAHAGRRTVSAVVIAASRRLPHGHGVPGQLGGHRSRAARRDGVDLQRARVGGQRRRRTTAGPGRQAQDVAQRHRARHRGQRQLRLAAARSIASAARTRGRAAARGDRRRSLRSRRGRSSRPDRRDRRSPGRRRDRRTRRRPRPRHGRPRRPARRLRRAGPRRARRRRSRRLRRL